jgi:hypothetical protein
MLGFNNISVYHHFLAIDQNKSAKSEKMFLFAMLISLSHQFCLSDFNPFNDTLELL